jgi:hypothetical protein
MAVLDRLRRWLASLVGPARRADGSRKGNRVVTEKVQADRDGEFVVFQIGMRINRFWKVHRWLPVALVAPRMVRELQSDPDSGLLGSRTVVGPGLRNIGFVQYWESFEALREYAHDTERRHRPAWVDYYQDGTADDSAVGIWHETYVVGEDDHESVYNNVPPHGLGAAEGTDLVPATGDRETAADRLGRAEATDAGDD